jgi:GTP-binding protein
MFRDEIEITLIAGRGGDGLVSFHREKFNPRGGPDGGDGGHGGSIFLVAAADRSSLLELGRQRTYRAGNGAPGGPQLCTGRDGADLELLVPEGTQVFDAGRENLLRDLAHEGMRLEVVRGGRGGRGNARFKNAVRQAPRAATPGRPGEERRVRLELKIAAEVGLLGLPNAGKSTFLARVTAARPKIADYAFTTLAPQVGIARVGDYDTLCIADLPGLVEGAAQGVGLGLRFLRHVERCKVLLHLVDVSEGAMDPVAAHAVIVAELAQATPGLVDKPRIVVATKVEGPAAEARAEELARALGQPVLRMSAVTGRGVDLVLQRAHAAARSRPGAIGAE